MRRAMYFLCAELQPFAGFLIRKKQPKLYMTTITTHYFFDLAYSFVRNQLVQFGAEVIHPMWPYLVKLSTKGGGLKYPKICPRIRASFSVARPVVLARLSLF